MLVYSGGFEVVSSGAAAGDATLSGGTAGASTITFAGSGTLRLDDSAAFAGMIAGLATPAAQLALLGQYVAANINLASDGHRGTLLTDPPVEGLAGQPFLTQPNHG